MDGEGDISPVGDVEAVFLHVTNQRVLVGEEVGGAVAVAVRAVKRQHPRPIGWGVARFRCGTLVQVVAAKWVERLPGEHGVHHDVRRSRAGIPDGERYVALLTTRTFEFEEVVSLDKGLGDREGGTA